jgi:hypothetical protein
MEPHERTVPLHHSPRHSILFSDLAGHPDCLLHLSGRAGGPLQFLDDDPSVTAADVARQERFYGIDRSIPVQYVVWLLARIGPPRQSAGAAVNVWPTLPGVSKALSGWILANPSFSKVSRSLI